MKTSTNINGNVRKWKRYPAYQESGIKWLGCIPSLWNAKRLKHLSRQPMQYGANEAAELNDHACPRFIRITDVTSDGGLREETFKSLPEEVAAPFLLKAGDLLFARSGATVGKTFLYQESWGRACYAGYLIRFRSDRNQVQEHFLSYFCSSSAYQGWLSSVIIRATIQNVSAEKYANLRISLPSLDEQKCVVAFLDRETAKIDALIAKKERLIELLQEKRTALISHAVTKGLDPSVPMKDSGVEWLGKIPAHWTVKRLKFCLYKMEQGWSPSCENRIAEDHEWAVLKVGCVNGTEFDSTENKALPPDLDPLPELEIRPGDVLMSRANTRELLGSCSMVQTVRPRLLLCDKLYRLHRRPSEIEGEFLVHALGSRVARYQMEREATGASGSMQNIAQGTVWNLILPLPTCDEQVSILRHIHHETTELDQLVGKVREAVEKLREYRTALISAAVTGKIDVREEVES